MRVKFYLGVAEPSWIDRIDVPMFISARRLRRQRTHKRATASWALDSGGFSEISKYGTWNTTPMEYAISTRRWANEIGGMDWAAIQDWMCEDEMLKKTGLTIRKHQQLTIESYLDLMSMAPDLPWMPVLQGFEPSDYLRHLDMYRKAGFEDMAFGLGSVCRRQETGGVHGLIRRLSVEGFKIHAFGFKTSGIRACGEYLESSDSMAWSLNARKNPPMDGHTHQHCSSCLPWAMRWRRRLCSTCPAIA